MMRPLSPGSENEEQRSRRIVSHLRSFISTVEIRVFPPHDHPETEAASASGDVQTSAPALRFSTESYIDLYNQVYRMCTRGRVGLMCRVYCQELKNYLERCVLPQMDRASRRCNCPGPMGLDQSRDRFLDVWSKRYAAYRHVARGFRDAFMYLERFLNTPEASVVANEYNIAGRNPLSDKARCMYQAIVYEPYRGIVAAHVSSALQSVRQCAVVASGSGGSSSRAEYDDASVRKTLLLIKNATRPLYEVERCQKGPRMTAERPDSDYVKHSVYNGYRMLESKLVRSQREFYASHRSAWIDRLGVAGYVTLVERALDFESTACEACFLGRTGRNLERACRNSLLRSTGPKNCLAGASNVLAMLRSSNFKDLNRIFRLYRPHISDLSGAWDALAKFAAQECARCTGRALDREGAPRNSAGHSAGVQAARHLAGTYDRFCGIVRDVFESHATFQSAVDQAFRSIVNAEPSAPSNMALAAHVALTDKNGAPDNRLFLKQLPPLYAILNEKDVFDDAYQKHLQMRLLNQTVVSESLEKKSIARLSGAAGYQWARCLHGMFEDCDRSRALCRDFARAHPRPDLRAVVGRNGNWFVAARGMGAPLRMARLPAEAQLAREKFEAFYKSRFASRELTWRVDMGSAVVSVTFRPRSDPVDLVVTTRQMIILGCFARERQRGGPPSVVHLSDIAQALGFSGDRAAHDAAQHREVQDHLLSLLHPSLGQARVLQKRPPGKVLRPGDKFRLNPKFSSGGARRIKIPLRRGIGGGPLGSASDPNRSRHLNGEARDAQIRIQKQRHNLLDASIVRMMKKARRATHAQVVSEVAKMTRARFTPTPSMIKKRIEHLMEQNYIARDTDQRNVYHYLA